MATCLKKQVVFIINIYFGWILLVFSAFRVYYILNGVIL